MLQVFLVLSSVSYLNTISSFQMSAKKHPWHLKYHGIPAYPFDILSQGSIWYSQYQLLHPSVSESIECQLAGVSGVSS